MIRAISIFSACLAASFAPGSLYAKDAQDTDREGTSREEYRATRSVSEQPTLEATDSTQVLFRAQNLMGRSVQTEDGLELGELAEIVFHPKVGIYGVVDAGGDRQVPVPWSEVKAVTGKAIVVSVDPARFRQAPAITNDQWATFNSPQFTQHIKDFYKQGPKSQAAAGRSEDQNPGRGPEAASAREGGSQKQQVFFRAEPLLGRAVYTTQDQELGDLNEIVFHPQIGIFAVVDSGNDRLVPVPWTLVTAVTEDSIVLNTTSQAFQAAPGFEDGQWSTFNRPQFTQSIRSHFARGLSQGENAQGGSSELERSSSSQIETGAGTGKGGVNTTTNSAVTNTNSSNLNTNTEANYQINNTNSTSSAQKREG